MSQRRAPRRRASARAATTSWSAAACWRVPARSWRTVLRRPDAIVVTDANLAATPHLGGSRSESGERRRSPRRCIVAAGRRDNEEHGAARRAAGPAARSGRRAGHADRGVRRRGGRRSRRLRRRDPAARARLRADPDHAARPGRQRDRRQDRHQHPPRQEPDRRLPPAAPRAGRHRRAGEPARPRAARRLCRGGQVRPDRPAGVLRLAGAPRARRCWRAMPRRSSTPCWRAAAPRRRWSRPTSARAARAPCSISAIPSRHAPRGGVRLRRRAAARRGGCRSAWCSRSTCRSVSGCAPPPMPTGCAPTSPPSACRPRSRGITAGGFAADALLAAMGHDKKVQARPPALRSARGIGQAFAGAEVEPAELAALLRRPPDRHCRNR